MFITALIWFIVGFGLSFGIAALGVPEGFALLFCPSFFGASIIYLILYKHKQIMDRIDGLKVKDKDK